MKEKTDCKNPRMAMANRAKLMLLSKFAVCGCEKLRFMEKQETGGLFSNLKIRTSLSKTPLLGDILFEQDFVSSCYIHVWNEFKTTKIYIPC